MKRNERERVNFHHHIEPKILTIFFPLLFFIKLVSPRPVDQEPEQHIISVIIIILAIIICVLVAVILFIVSKNRRTRTAAVLNALQHNQYSDGLAYDKRLNSNFKVSMDDNESIDKSSLYHEPFNVNMYTSAASGCTLNDMQQRLHVTPDYTGELNILSFLCSYAVLSYAHCVWMLRFTRGDEMSWCLMLVKAVESWHWHNIRVGWWWGTTERSRKRIHLVTTRQHDERGGRKKWIWKSNLIIQLIN